MSYGTAARTWWGRLARAVLRLPADLAAVVLFVGVGAVTVLLPGVYGTPLAVAIGVPLLLLAPGYALVALLYPAAPPRLGDGRGIRNSDRLALGFGLSVALLPVVGLALSLSPLAIGPTTVMATVGGLTILVAVGAWVRRLRLSADRRFGRSVREWLFRVRSAASGVDASLDGLVSIALAVAVLAAFASVGYAVVAPNYGGSFTEFYLLSENDDGELVQAGYPSSFEVGEARPMVVGLENREGETVSYTVVIELQRVRQAEDGSAVVLQDRELSRRTPTVPPGHIWRARHSVRPTMAGEDLRLVYLLYKGEPPADPSTANAYRHLHVWIDVSP